MADRHPPDEGHSGTNTGSSNDQDTVRSGDAPRGEPGQRPRVGGFAAIVDAFMSSFRQAMTAQEQAQRDGREHTQDQGHVAHTIPPDRNQDSHPSGQPDDTPVQAGARRPEEPAPVHGQPSTPVPPTDAAASEEPRTLLFRMPFITGDGQSATLAFRPGPIPVPAQLPEQRPTYGPERPDHLGPERGNGRASGFHLPLAPIFVPLGASPLPFSFIFDTQTNTAWPIAAISNTPPGGLPAEDTDANEPRFVAGPPFHVALNISFGPPPEPERADPERALRFVNSLERADAELRNRMARLGMGAIGDYGGSQENEGREGALGCGICLDEYPSEDRPEWIGGQDSKDEEVVAVPCAGHHTLHHRCLYDWLAKTAPSEWTCPFCRAGLDKRKVDNSASGATNFPREAQEAPPDDTAKRAEQEAKARSLREEVRLREKGRGWRCDSPACLPRYPRRASTSSFDQTTSNRLISLLPCRHTLHLDCLFTSMKLEHASNLHDGEEGEQDEDEDEDEEADAAEGTGDRSASWEGAADTLAPLHIAKDTVGKWVTCPTCRHEAWAELPMKKKSKRVEAAKAKLGHGHHPLAWPETEASTDSGLSSQTDESSLSLGSKRPLDLPTFGARERARLHDVQSQTDGQENDSDGDVEAMLH